VTFIRLGDPPTLLAIAVCIVIGVLLIIADSVRLGAVLIVSMLVLAGYRLLRGSGDTD
jgi:hypothetical protein